MSTQHPRLSPPTCPRDPAHALRGRYRGELHLPGEQGYDRARRAWNLAVDQRPAAVAYPTSAAEVADAVTDAAAAGLRIAPQSTGHNAGPLGSLDDVLLLRTSAMTEVSIDPETRRARVAAGALWLPVVEAAASDGLAALHGSAPSVGVTGYSLSGGIGWYARALGLQTNSLTAVELVLADGQRTRTDPTHDAELFWALRGGGGNFGIVTALEFDLFAIDTIYAGALMWDWHDAERVLRRWSEWAIDAPETVTTAFRIIKLPPLDTLPAQLRGRRLATIDGAALVDDADAERLLAPLRELAPEADTFRRTSAGSLARLHGDPEAPVPAVSDTAMLASLPVEAVQAFVAAAGPGSDSTLVSAELRQLGGALGRTRQNAGALASLDGAFALWAVAVAPDATARQTGTAHARRLKAAMAPVAYARPYLGFSDTAADTASGYPPDVYQRLARVRAEVDPDQRLLAGHAIA